MTRLAAIAMGTGLIVAAAVVGGCSSGGDGTGGGAGGSSGGGTGGHAGTAGGVGGRSGAGGGTVVIDSSSGCPLFTPDDAWNTDISAAPVDATWTATLQSQVGAINIHPDFGPDFGIPINVVPATQPPVPVAFDGYPEESDPGPYPFPDPSVARVEGTSDPHSCSGDCHLVTVQKGACMLYEGYACQYQSDGWHCSNGAKWDLTKKSYGQRPEGWTSVDAAGLAVYAGLARYEEVMAGEITHAIRFTVKCTTGSHVPPATHDAVPDKCDPTGKPPMGLRVRLKGDFDTTGYGPTAQVFLRAFKKYGMILADNGSNFYFQSEENPAWPDDVNDLKRVPASAFEVLAF
jgi:hypothetical protein